MNKNFTDILRQWSAFPNGEMTQVEQIMEYILKKVIWQEH